jgi:hypothetical protein
MMKLRILVASALAAVALAFGIAGTAFANPADSPGAGDSPGNGSDTSDWDTGNQHSFENTAVVGQYDIPAPNGEGVFNHFIDGATVLAHQGAGHSVINNPVCALHDTLGDHD